jgi:4,5-DOPA dioxygenase extradiol
MSNSAKTPVFFISHGAPTFALDPGLLGPQLRELGAALPPVRAVLVVSPHWQTLGVKVMTTELPETVHDFGGFAAELYTLRYPAPGAPQVAREVAQLLEAAGIASGTDERRGLDHGTWVPLMHLLPQARVPVFQVSMPFDLDTVKALRLGQALAPLREQGVLVVASGAMTHNLQEFRQASTAANYAQEFADWVNAAVRARATSALLDYRREAPHAQRAHPSEEHFLPLLVALGASGEDEPAHLLEGGMTYGVISMDSFVWGTPGGVRP